MRQSLNCGTATFLTLFLHFSDLKQTPEEGGGGLEQTGVANKGLLQICYESGACMYNVCTSWSSIVGKEFFQSGAQALEFRQPVIVVELVGGEA